MDKLSFLAYLPNIQSAISAGGDGIRLKLDVPETDMPEALKMVTLKGKVFRVTVEPEEDQG